MPRLWCGAVIIPLIWFYTYATGWQPSAIRSTIMMTIIIGGWALKRPSDLLNSLAVAGLIILTYDPRQLFGASFQLSFFVVLSIALFVPPLEKVRERLLQTDPLLPSELIPRWKRWLHTPLRFLFTSLTTSIAAFLGSWPLVAYYFHIFSPITLIANLIVVPLSSFALACNLGSLICGSWLSFITVLFNNSAWFWMSLIVHFSKAIIKIPCAYFYVAGPTMPDFVIYYVALIAVLSGFAFKKRIRKWTFAAAICLVAFYGWRWYLARTTTTLTVLPLYGGSAVFVQPGDARQNLLIDCGNTNLVDSVMVPFLHGRGINHIPALALTHGDLRDVGGALEIRDSFSVEHVFTSNIRFRSTTYRRIVDALEQTPGLLVTVDRGDSIGRWQVLSPAATNHFTQADDSALVLKGEFHGVRVLLLSDLGRPGQYDLLQTTNDLRADIVVTGLPQENEPVCDALLEVIKPQLIIVADSDLPATRRASSGLHDRLAQRKIPALYTREEGSTSITIRSKVWTVTTMSGDKYSGHIPEK